MTTQTVIWDLPAGRGRPRFAPWGLPHRLWETARLRAYRRGQKSREEIFAVLQGVIVEEQARPWWEPREAKDSEPSPKKVARTVEEVVFPADRVTDSLRRMINRGQLPGHKWDAVRGVVREIVVMRMVG